MNNIEIKPIVEGKTLEAIGSDINNNFDKINDKFNSTNEVVFGYYAGDYDPPEDSLSYSSARIIDLGFTPVWVELWCAGHGGFLSLNGSEIIYGGIATRNRPAYGTHSDCMFSIVDNGIEVFEIKDYRDSPVQWTSCNRKNIIYLFKAYKDTIPSTKIKEYK